MAFQVLLKQTIRHRLIKNLKSTARRFCSTPETKNVHILKSRGVIKVTGQDAIPFLQGLVTNDVALLGQEMKAQYTMLLNVQGRVLYDLIVYDISEGDLERSLLLECDRSLLKKALSDVSRYKIRKKVTLEDLSESHHVVASPGCECVVGSIISTPDPRVPVFGYRGITDAPQSQVCESGYHERRLQWGIPEGPLDLPPGNCLPLESNLVYMNGVSFGKGCYLGQELTARTHHTGVTRKRLMPLVFHGPPGDIEAGQSILNENGKSVGKFRSVTGHYGLGLMRLADVTGNLTLVNTSGASVAVKAVRPDWWPSE